MNQPIEINLKKFSHRASIYLLGAASAWHVTPEEALKAILEVVCKRMMFSFESDPRQGALTRDVVKSGLDTRGQGGEWQLEQCFVKKSTVNRWFERTKEVPAVTPALIQGLMREPQGVQKSIREEVCHA